MRLSPGKSRYPTFAVLELHFSGKGVYQDLSASAGNTFPKATWKGRVELAVTFVNDYSYLNAIMGSTRVARRAGT